LLFRVAVVQALSIVVALLVGPLVLLLALGYFLRRQGGRASALFRVEVVNSGLPGVIAVQQVPVPGQPADTMPPEQAFAEEPPPAEYGPAGTAEAFDLGPTYEEEKRAREAAARQADEAVLRHVFQVNVQLREQIAGLAGPQEDMTPVPGSTLELLAPEGEDEAAPLPGFESYLYREDAGGTDWMARWDVGAGPGQMPSTTR
jgi:hypothetical protein